MHFTASCGKEGWSIEPKYIIVLHELPIPTGLLQVVKQYVRIPVYAMIRPRGGDFLYSDREVEVMRKDIEMMKNHGADGLVLGALTEDGRVDAELCMELLGKLLHYSLLWWLEPWLLSWLELAHLPLAPIPVDDWRWKNVGF